MRARALFAFEGRADDELSFEKGDVIEGVAVVDADWWAGDRAGIRGVFPSSYVEALATAPSAAPDGTPPLAAAPVAPEMTAVSLDEEDDDARFSFLRRATFKKREKKKNDYFFHSWGYAVSRRGDNLPVFVFLRPRKDEKRCDDDDNNETILWRELFLLDEK